MSYWNHRVIKRIYPHDKVLYGIYEVYYNDDDLIWSYTEEPRNIQCESVEELRQSLKWMIDCLDKEVLIYDKIKTIDYNEIKLEKEKKQNEKVD